MSNGLFDIRVNLTPEAETSPMFTNPPQPTMADLQLRIMHLESMLVYCDNCISALVPLVPGLATTRAEIAKALERPTNQRIQ